jgi:hypothetical protein
MADDAPIAILADGLRAACQKAGIALPPAVASAIDFLLDSDSGLDPVEVLADAVLQSGWVAAEAVRPLPEADALWASLLAALLRDCPRCANLFAPAFVAKPQHPQVGLAVDGDIDGAFPPTEEEGLRAQLGAVRAELAERRASHRALTAGNAGLRARLDALQALGSGRAGRFGAAPGDWGTPRCAAVDAAWRARDRAVTGMAQVLAQFRFLFIRDRAFLPQFVDLVKSAGRAGSPTHASRMTELLWEGLRK